jgi:hypothetical protein
MLLPSSCVPILFTEKILAFVECRAAPLRREGSLGEGRWTSGRSSLSSPGRISRSRPSAHDPKRGQAENPSIGLCAAIRHAGYLASHRFSCRAPSQSTARRLLPYYLRTSVTTQPHDHRCTLSQLSKKEALGPRRNRGSITTTLYVTDEGDGVTTFNPGTNRYTDAAAQTKAGLQKWIFDADAGTWKLAYVLQAGLDLGVPYTISNYPTGTNPVTGLPWSPATDGLRNLTGRVHRDGTVTLWAITSTVSGSGKETGEAPPAPRPLPPEHKS